VNHKKPRVQRKKVDSLLPTVGVEMALWP
jgi:hypothetical protein